MSHETDADANDGPPPVDPRLLALANRALVEQVRALEAKLDAEEKRADDWLTGATERRRALEAGFLHNFEIAVGSLGGILSAIGDLDQVFFGGGLMITGGFLARERCGIAERRDLDVICDVDSYSRLRSAMRRAGYTLVWGETSTGFREARGDADMGVYFREKWTHPNRIDIDCLILMTTDSHDIDDTLLVAATKFIHTYDYMIGRQLLFWQDGAPVWLEEAGVRSCVRARLPGWVDGAVTHRARRARWDAMLAGEVSDG